MEKKNSNPLPEDSSLLGCYAVLVSKYSFLVRPSPEDEGTAIAETSATTQRHNVNISEESSTTLQRNPTKLASKKTWNFNKTTARTSNLLPLCVAHFWRVFSVGNFHDSVSSVLLISVVVMLELCRSLHHSQVWVNICFFTTLPSKADAYRMKKNAVLFLM